MFKSRYRRLLLVASASGMAVPFLASTVSAAEEKLEEIIVTAEKRPTELQKTPQAINVVKGSELAEASVTEIKDLALLLPGININPQGFGNRNEITIRGVAGVTAGDPSNQPSVAVVIDGVYSQSGIAGAGGFFDVQQVEVAKGPQGTLYGRNATAGVISMATQRPKFANEGQASVNLGNYGRVNANGMVNVALSDRWAIRMAAQSSKRNGFFKDGFSDEDTIGGRLGIAFNPTSDLSLLLRGDYSIQGGKGNASTQMNPVTAQPVGGDPWLGPTNPLWVDASTRANYGALYGSDAQRHDINWGINPELEWKLGSATLTALGSYKRSTMNDVDLSFNGTYNDSREKSLEVRMASNDENTRLRWQAGAYYYRQDLRLEIVRTSAVKNNVLGPITTGGRFEDYDLSKLTTNPTCVPNPFFGPCTLASHGYGGHNAQLNYALFTQETFSITDALHLIAGGRWQSEEAIRGGSFTQNYDVNGPLGAPTYSEGSPSRRWNAVTWKLGVDMQVAPNSMVYLMASTGWKAGNAQQYDPPHDQQKPEKMLAYALGSKNRFFDDRLQLNGELFYWDYRDRQISRICVPGVNQGGLPVPGTPACQNISGVVFFLQDNASKSHTQGASLDLAYRPFHSDTVTAGIEYLDEAIHDDMNGTNSNGCTANCPMSNAPKWSTTLSWRHIFEMNERGRFAFDFRTKYETRQLLDIAATSPIQIQESYHLSNAGLSYSPAENKWNIRGYVDNIENELVKYFGFGGFGGNGSAGYQNPRTYGVQLQANF